jgi:oxygen-independent coproporphyrinogen-3 oxidase
MDHFALKEDPLFIAAKSGNLHRNFMGYTTQPSALLLGLGVSSISDSLGAFVQNEKSVDLYEQRLSEGQLPHITGHYLDREDRILRGQILNLMCRQETVVPWDSLDPKFVPVAKEKLKSLESDELVLVAGDHVRITSLGRLFVRNISSALDARLWRKQRNENQFSRSI